MKEKKMRKMGKDKGVKAKKGDKYKCEECGLVVTVEDPCCCDVCDIVCCDESMTLL